MKLRDYQNEAVNSVVRYFEEGNKGNPIIAMPTGTGKSLVIAGFLDMVYSKWPDQRIIMLTHVKELIEQNYAKAKALLPHLSIGLNSAGLNKRQYFNPVVFAGIGSVAKDAWRFGHIDLILIDECHMVSSNSKTMYRRFLDELREINPHLKVIGLTATPWRLKTGALIEDEDGIFTDICFNSISMESFNRYIAEGYLTPLVPKPTVVELDMTGVGTSGGEFINSQMQKAVDKDEITQKAIMETLEHGDDRKCWLIFAAGVEHAIHIADALNDMGIPAVAIHGKLSKTEREKALADYKAGVYRAAVNNNVLTTGFDHPDIDLIVMLRPTKSVVLWVQMLGRGTRCVYADGYDLSTEQGRHQAIDAGGKHDCLVLDFAGNTKRIGPINDPNIPSKYKKSKGAGTEIVKLCEKCGNYVHAARRFCDVIEKGKICNFEFTFETKLHQEASTTELIKNDNPVYEDLKIDYITYSTHFKKDKPPSVKVSYYFGVMVVNEFLCFEHEQYARRQSVKFWEARTAIPVPSTTEEAMNNFDKLQRPTHARVWVNKKYKEIINFCFDGSNFGQIENPVIHIPEAKKQTEVNLFKRRK